MSWAVQGAWGQLRCPQGAAMRPVGHLCLSRVAAAAERLISPAPQRSTDTGGRWSLGVLAMLGMFPESCLYQDCILSN